MHAPTLHIHLTVEEVLQNWPQAFSVFLKKKTQCPGCFMQRLCTLEDVSEIYRISADQLIADLERSNHSERTRLALTPELRP